MKRDLAGQRILVTGASSGMGRALAEHAAAAGMRVVLTARSGDVLTQLATDLQKQGREALVLPADLTSATERTKLLQDIQERLGGLDVLANVAGIGVQGLFTDSTEELLRQVMEVNFFAPVELIRQAVPLLEKGRQPAVVQVASMCGRRSMPFWTEYSASKFALCGLMEALRAEFVRQGIDVCLIVPGVTQTNLGKNLLRHDGRIAFKFEHGMTTAYVAQQILKALRLGRAETVLGWEARWIVRTNRWLPRLVDALLARVVRQRFPTRS